MFRVVRLWSQSIPNTTRAKLLKQVRPRHSFAQNLLMTSHFTAVKANVLTAAVRPGTSALTSSHLSLPSTLPLACRRSAPLVFLGPFKPLPPPHLALADLSA